MTVLQRKKIETLNAQIVKQNEAIKAFCMACVGDVMSDVKGCTAKKCPLYKLRPYK